jgi:predicted ester cyclase
MDDNKQIVTRFVEELWNQRNLDVADAIFDSQCHTHQLRSGVPDTPVSRGPESIKKHVGEWLSGFPDLQFTIEQILSDGDRVATQMVMDGTHTGEWIGILPTGKRVNIRMTAIHRIHNGKIIEDWVLVESLGVFQQFGVLPSTQDFLADFIQRNPVAPLS